MAEKAILGSITSCKNIIWDCLTYDGSFRLFWLLANTQLVWGIRPPLPIHKFFLLGCLIFLCIDLCIRLFALKLPGLNLLHYRLHNIPSSTLRRYILVVNKLNSFNLITLLLIIPALFQLADLTKGLGLLFVFYPASWSYQLRFSSAKEILYLQQQLPVSLCCANGTYCFEFYLFYLGIRTCRP